MAVDGFGAQHHLYHYQLHTMNSNNADILLVGFGGSTPAPVSFIAAASATIACDVHLCSRLDVM